MPNYVKNILSFDGDQDQVSRLFSTIQGENGPVDFDKLIPMPSELEIESGSRTAAGFKKYMAFFGGYRFTHRDGTSLPRHLPGNRSRGMGVGKAGVSQHPGIWVPHLV